MINGSVWNLSSDLMQVSSPARRREALRDERSAAINTVPVAPRSQALICCLLKS